MSSFRAWYKITPNPANRSRSGGKPETLAGCWAENPEASFKIFDDIEFFALYFFSVFLTDPYWRRVAPLIGRR
jgi:hypothetical protein